MKHDLTLLNITQYLSCPCMFCHRYVTFPRILLSCGTAFPFNSHSCLMNSKCDILFSMVRCVRSVNHCWEMSQKTQRALSPSHQPDTALSTAPTAPCQTQLYSINWQTSLNKSKCQLQEVYTSFYTQYNFTIPKEILSCLTLNVQSLGHLDALLKQQFQDPRGFKVSKDFPEHCTISSDVAHTGGYKLAPVVVNILFWSSGKQIHPLKCLQDAEINSSKE